MTRGRRSTLPLRSHIRRKGGAFPWYATALEFQRELEDGLATHPEHSGRVTAGLAPRRSRNLPNRVLVYRHAGLEIPGRRELAPVSIEFHEHPNYDTYGLRPCDYPRVLADLGKDSPHRLLDDALCLWFPSDPEDQRWASQDGLVALLDTVRNHLFFEDHWRRTGGHRQGTWLGREAPHGFPEERAA